ncbi:MAG: amidase [bacterium]|nr:amidase [bacterium]
MNDLCLLPATELIAKIKNKTISVREMVQAHLDRIDELEDEVQAWAFLDQGLALKTADAIDRKIADSMFKGTLFGVPAGIKDIFNTLDMPTAMGSPVWEGFTPGNDARVVHYLRMQGAVFPGKTVTAEFAVHAPGKTRNPHHLDYSPGTSSSGSAAAVACHMVPIALGTQTAGSIIRPASYCGVYGFKPSFGLIPRTGVLKTTDTLDTVGGFARTPGDLALLFETIRVHGLNFPVSHAAFSDPARREKGSRPWRVGLVPSISKKYGAPYAVDALNLLIKELEASGEVEFVEKQMPDEFDEAHEIHATLYEKSLAYYFDREFSQTEFISKIIHEMISRGVKISPEAYEDAIEKQRVLSGLLDEEFMDCDAILTLSTQGIAPKKMESDQPDTCLVWTLCGVPTINVPLFRGPQGMPFGAQIVGRRFNDYLLLEFAEFLDTFKSENLEMQDSKKIDSLR